MPRSMSSPWWRDSNKIASGNLGTVHGDIVVVWPRKKGPLVARRLARCAPYDTFHFRTLGRGDVFELPCNKVCAIHALAGEARS